MSTLNNILVLSKDNQQLLDVFSDDYYLELGNIKPDSLQRLLKYKPVDYNDLAYFDIQNKGIGTSEIKDELLKRNIPYIYFDNLSKKRPQSHLFITYGIYVQKKGYKEYFTPIFLLPVVYYYNNGKFTFQMVGSIIENPYLPINKKYNETKAEKLNNIYDLDEFIMSAFKKENLRLESYLTCANIETPDAVFVGDKFSLEGPTLGLVHSTFNLTKQSDICNISSLNREQREALEEANYGNSFALTGVIGTGKTRTLENIAANAIYKGKKVLYVSNNDETLNDVYTFYKEKGLGYLVTNLNYPVKNKSEKNKVSGGVVIDKITKNELDVKYDGIKNYSQTLYSRINNTPFLDILDALVTYRNVNNDLTLDTLKGIENLYRLEAIKVKDALSLIDENLSRINSFKDSKFNNIPIKNLENKKSILKLLKSANDEYTNLLSKKNILERVYGFDKVQNYAYFRNMINNFHQINPKNIPISWITYTSRDSSKKKLIYFDQAKELYIQFAHEMTSVKQMETKLRDNYDYDTLMQFDLHSAINLLKTKYQYDDDINKFLKDNEVLCDKLDRIRPVIDDCEYNFGKMRDKVGVKMNNHDTASIEEISSFVTYFDTINVPKLWLDIRKSNETRTKIISLQENLFEYCTLKEEYEKYFTDLNNIDSNIDLIRKKSKKKGLYHNENAAELINKFARLKELIPHSDSLFTTYKTYTLKDYQKGMDEIETYDEFIRLLKGINNETIQAKFIKNISTSTDASLKEFIKPFLLFSESYNKINNLYSDLVSYGLATENDDLPAKIITLQKMKEYCDMVLQHENKMNLITRNKEGYVEFSKYTSISKDVDEITTLRQSINTNKEYKKLYGNMFTDYNSDIEIINKEINNFNLYINIFKDNQSLSKSLEKTQFDEIDKELNESFNICEKINESITDYSKIFRDSVTKFYYDDLDKMISFLSDLIESQNELDVYLHITDGMKVLLQYKLNNFVKYITDHDNEKFENRFMIAYYTYLYETFKKDNVEITNSEGYYKLLHDITEWENEICSTNIDKIKSLRTKNSSRASLKGLDYESYLNKVKDSKYLYLCSSRTLNSFVNISHFDLVLVDDANIGEYDQYVYTLNAPQVIFAGNNDVHFGIFNDVFSKIRKSATIELKYRFTITPHDLLNSMNRCYGSFYHDENKNNGLEIVDTNVSDIISNLLVIKTDDNVYKVDTSIKVNIFSNSINKIRSYYDEITNKLLEYNIKEEAIYDLFNNNINICDLSLEYIYNSNYNIIDLEDYYLENNTYTISNLLTNLLCVKDKLFVIDKTNLMKDYKKYNFVEAMHDISKNDVVINSTDNVCNAISKTLSKYKIKVLGKYKFFDLIVQKNNKNYGIVIYNTPTTFDNNIINVNRYITYTDIKCIVLFMNDIATNFDASIKKITEAIDHEL